MRYHAIKTLRDKANRVIGSMAKSSNSLKVISQWIDKARETYPDKPYRVTITVSERQPYPDDYRDIQTVVIN